MPQASKPSSSALALIAPGSSGTESIPVLSWTRLDLLLADKLAKHVRQDAAVTERDELFRRIDPHQRVEFDRCGADGLHMHRARGAEPLGNPLDLEHLRAGDPQRRRVRAVL